MQLQATFKAYESVCRISSCFTGFRLLPFPPKLNGGTLFSLKLSGADILDTIDSEAAGTLKDCYVTLGGCLHGWTLLTSP